MQKAAVAEGIIDIPAHLAAICFEPFQLQALSVPVLPQYVQIITPEEIIQRDIRLPLHINHPVLNVEQLYTFSTLSTIV